MIRMSHVTALSTIFLGCIAHAASAQTSGPGGPVGSPITVWASAESGLQGCGCSDGWYAEISVSGDAIDTDDDTYFTNSCTATSANGGASYNSTLTLTMYNFTGSYASGTWSGQRSVEGAVEAAAPHFAHSSVIRGPGNLLYDETSLPDKNMYNSYYVYPDTVTTDEIEDGEWQAFDDFFTLEGAGG